MHAKQLVKRSIIVGFIFLAILGLIFSSTTTAIKVSAEDGVWTDSFDDADTVKIQNCSVINGTIMLNSSTQPRKYDFTESGHDAYWYQTPFFIPLKFTQSIFEHSFNAQEESNIKKPNETPETKYAIKPSTIIKRYVVHRFRFELDVDKETVGELEVNWLGKIENTDNPVKIYLWRYGELEQVPRWWLLNQSGTVGEDIKLSKIITEDVAKLALADDNFMDICVVASHPLLPFLQNCILYTDYINITSPLEKVYEPGPGIATTNVSIDPKTISGVNNFYWDILTWEDYVSDRTSVRYHVLYKDGSGNYTLVDDNYFSDGKNSEGFTDPPVHLNKIPTHVTDVYDELKIMANLTTDRLSKSPRVFSWTITWQTNSSRWQDLFNYEYRLDEKNKIKIEGGTVQISPIQGEWTLFGYDPQNTRATDGDGAHSSDLYWYSVEEVGGGFRSPVMADQILYISDSSQYLHRYNIIAVEEGEGQNEIGTAENMHYEIANSPAVTDSYVIVATGEIETGGLTNIIRVMDKNSLSTFWRFYYNGDICYYASPVVDNDKLFISTWGGGTTFNPGEKNNKVIALDLTKGEFGEIYDNDDELMIWEYSLPAKSFSTPAVYNNMVFVGCSESDEASLFAINIENGNVTWSQSVGSIGRASPVVYKDTVFVTSKTKGLLGMGNIKITALNVEDGNILWSKEIGDLTSASADSTPAIYNDILYVASPDGSIYAYNIKDGNEPDEPKWSKQVYRRLEGQLESLVSSPAYADGLIYIGTPAGIVYGLGIDNGTEEWSFETFIPPLGNRPSSILSSPIVSNGLVFISDEDGKLYSIGSYKEPDEEIEGSLVSIPINLPTGSWWQKFYVSYNATAAGNDIKFSLLDEDKNFLKNLLNESRILLDNATVGRTVRLQAELSADNISVNPELYSWYVTFEPDHEKPVIALDTFYPAPDGWLNEMKVPEFTVEVKDNETGLRIDTAKCTLKYKVEDGTDTQTFNINCTGEDGTTDTELITANITSLDIYENITELVHIEISISDLAGNENTTDEIEFKQDTVKPESDIDNETNDKQFNTSFVVINATSDDPGIEGVNSSGVALVELRYRHSLSSVFSGPWELYDVSNVTSPSWNFTDIEGGGYYELTTIATDVVGNVEDEPVEGDVTFILDPNAPSKPILEDTYWFNALPEISIEFADDFKLDKIEYRPNFEPEWTDIDSNVGTQTYDDEWDLSQDYWDQMVEGEEYSLYFRLTDTLGNEYTSSVNDALKIRKDETAPHASLEIPELETEWSWYETFDISAFATDGDDGSGIKTVELYYRYSEDNETWSEWTLFGDSFTSEPYEWQFIAEKGDGHYEFKIVVEDFAGNVAESSVFATGLNIFHIYLLAAMVSLLVALILIIIILFIKWKKIE